MTFWIYDGTTSFNEIVASTNYSWNAGDWVHIRVEWDDSAPSTYEDQQKIFNIIGEPVHMKVYGEKKAGSFAKNSHQKRLRGTYPFWREPYMVGEEYTYFSSIKDLPGEGVVAMEFVK